MAEILIKVKDYIHPDSDKDRQGVHKRGDIINIKPDGWSAGEHWHQSKYPYANGNAFVLVKVPGLTVEEAVHTRESWEDDFDYEIVAPRPAHGEYDIRIFEKNAGAINQNSIAGVKATRVRNYLAGWGCNNFSMTKVDASFTFSLWNAVRSANFWEVPAVKMADLSFGLNSYANGVANITLTVSGEDITPQMIIRKIEEHQGTAISAVHPDYTFEIERSVILTKFKTDVKDKMEQTYMRHRYSVPSVDVAAVIANGGIMTITKAQFLNKLKDKMA